MKSKSEKYGVPAWVCREIRRLEKAAELGGSGAAAEFERQANGLRRKYIWGKFHGNKPLCEILGV